LIQKENRKTKNRQTIIQTIILSATGLDGR